MQRHEEAAFTMSAVLFDQDLFKAEIAHPCAAVLRICPDQQEALLSGLEKGLAIHTPLLTPAFGVWANLGLEEPAR
jgi:hypothetical protein